MSEETLQAIEQLARSHIKNQCLPDEAYKYISKLVATDCPRNAIELYNLICDFITDGMAYTDDEAFKMCEVIAKILIDKKLIVVDQRDTIVAEKLQNPVVLN